MKRITGLSVFVVALLGFAIAPSMGAAAGHKVFVNHKGNRICVALPSVSAHLGHGDVTNFMRCS